MRCRWDVEKLVVHDNSALSVFHPVNFQHFVFSSGKLVLLSHCWNISRNLNAISCVNETLKSSPILKKFNFWADHVKTSWRSLLRHISYFSSCRLFLGGWETLNRYQFSGIVGPNIVQVAVEDDGDQTK